MFRLREAVFKDVEALAIPISELGFDSSAELIEINLQALTRDGFPPLVADCGRVVGCVTYSVMQVLHRPAPAGRISMLIVAADWRGQGVGRSLVAAAVDRLRNAGCQLCEVTSNLALIDAHAFYERLGFEKTSVRLARKM
jgi:predicted N-acetyltransferase YhbS